MRRLIRGVLGILLLVWFAIRAHSIQDALGWATLPQEVTWLERILVPVVNWIPAFLVLAIIAWANWEKISEHLPANALVLLPDAANDAYEALQGSLLANAADFIAKTPEDTLNQYASYIAQEVPIFGKRFPSTRYEQISHQDLRPQHARIIAGGASLGRLGDSQPMFVELAVKRIDLRRAIKVLKTRRSV